MIFASYWTFSCYMSVVAVIINIAALLVCGVSITVEAVHPMPGVVDVPLVNYYDFLFWGDVQFGTPPQNFSLLMDINAGDTVVYSSQTVCGKKDYLSYYDHSKSMSYNATSGKEYNIVYSDGFVSGFASRDEMKIGGSFPFLDVQLDHCFVEAVNYSSSFNEASDAVYDGVLGLAGQHAAETTCSNFIDALIAQNITQERQFALYLKRNSHYGSLLSLGGYHPAFVEGDIHHIDALPFEKTDGKWMLTLHSLFVGGVNSDLCHRCSVHLSSRSGSALVVPQKDFATLIAAMSCEVATNGKENDDTVLIEGLDYRCETLPVLSLFIDGEYYNLESQDYFIDGGLQITMNQDVSVDYFIAGSLFLETIYSIYNLDKGTVGFARLPKDNDDVLSLWEETIIIIVAVFGVSTMLAVGIATSRIFCPTKQIVYMSLQAKDENDEATGTRDDLTEEKASAMKICKVHRQDCFNQSKVENDSSTKCSFCFKQIKKPNDEHIYKCCQCPYTVCAYCHKNKIVSPMYDFGEEDETDAS